MGQRNRNTASSSVSQISTPHYESVVLTLDLRCILFQSFRRIIEDAKSHSQAGTNLEIHSLFFQTSIND